MSHSTYIPDALAAWPLLACFFVGPALASGGEVPGCSTKQAESAQPGCAVGGGEAQLSTTMYPPALPGGRVQVPFFSIGGHILVPVRLDDSREVHMVLDTGMSAPIVLLHSRAVGDSPTLQDATPVGIAGAGGSDPVMGRMVQGASVSVGDLQLSEQTIIVTDELCGPAAFSMEGVIGKSIFDRYAVDIDFERSVLTILESADVDPTGMVSLPLTLEIGIPTIEATVENEDGSTASVRLVVDLGARHTLSLHPDPAKGIQAPKNALSTVVGRGIQGEVPGTVGRIPSLQLGSLSFTQVIGSFTSPQTGIACVEQGSKADGNLGIEILRRFHVVVDYPGRRLLLEPLPDYARPFEYNMAGLSLEQRTDGTYFIRDVIAGSPGDAAGIAPGDRIVAIEGRLPEGASYPKDMTLFQQPGKQLRVTIERGGERSDRNLELRRMI